MKGMVGGAASGSTDDKRTWTAAHSFQEAWALGTHPSEEEKIVAVRWA